MTIANNEHQRSLARGNLCRGRPVTATVTLVNMGNQPHRDNGEGLAATPAPYPLTEAFAVQHVSAAPSGLLLVPDRTGGSAAPGRRVFRQSLRSAPLGTKQNSE